ncbi:MAG: hypothetical protein LQ343_000918 [Gyalolechia ehrenbergii]|nr:MAG: hypothetical protein LQ343_000918 [Gyalolechia ehrenbergii]
MSNPRVEEVSESDSDPSIDDPTSYAPSLIRPSQIPPPTSSSRQANNNQGYLQPQYTTTKDPEAHKHYQCIYPLYFDASRTRAQGRRVGKESAVENPLARTIVDAVAELGLQTVFEPGKVHPRDWGNPGRVRVLLKDEGGRSRNGRVKNKHHLYLLISKYLLSHPTTPGSPLRLRVHGMPLPNEKEAPPPAVPRGWKLNRILPLHSPALSGGGVSENMLKDMMAGMQGGGMPGMPGMAGMLDGMDGGGGGGGGGGGKKKEKGKGGRKG